MLLFIKKKKNVNLLKFLPIILLASVLPCLPLFAGDEKLPPIQQFMSKENADRALNAIIGKYNPDLSYKFKQLEFNIPYPKKRANKSAS